MFQRLTHEIRPSDPKCGSHRTHKDTRFVLLPAAGASISKTLATDKELVLLSEWLSSKICPFRQSEIALIVPRRRFSDFPFASPAVSQAPVL